VTVVVPLVTGLAGVIVFTSAERHPMLRDFYVDTLGLRPLADRPGFVNFEWGPVRLTVSVHDRVEGESRDPLRVMINLAIDDLDAAHDRLRALDVPCLRPPEPEHWGGRIATYADPDGNLVQLFEFPDGAGR
jgi:catechol 2,3-dioxygenase-like lactoylglutathione lyase family enzyme